jgi:hypothetical protein
MTNKYLPPGGNAVSSNPQLRGDRDYAQKVTALFTESWGYAIAFTTMLGIAGFCAATVTWFGLWFALMFIALAMFMAHGALRCRDEAIGEVIDLQNTLSRLMISRAGRVAGEDGEGVGATVLPIEVLKRRKP